MYIYTHVYIHESSKFFDSIPKNTITSDLSIIRNSYLKKTDQRPQFSRNSFFKLLQMKN